MEALVGLIGLGFAAVGLVDVVIRAGLSIEDKIKAYKSADENLEKFRKIGGSMARGSLPVQLRLIHQAIKDDRVEAALATELDDAFKSIIKDIVSAEKNFDKVFGGGRAGRVKYALVSRSKLATLIDSIEKNQSLFLRLANYVQMAQAMPSPFQLTSSNFSIIHETCARVPGQTLPKSNIFVSRAMYKLSESDSNQEGDVILEKRETHSPDDLKNIEVLVQKLCSSKTPEGILPCVGFRTTGDLIDGCTLVFALREKETRQSLLEFIESSPKLALNERISLCQKLAGAVSKVHSLSLVHKSIRPTNILLTTLEGVQTLFITNWQLSRHGTKGMTNRRSTKLWPVALYQHPQRQGDEVDHAYTIVHDIYSLGVCMLELFLGKSFVSVDDTGTPQLSALFRRRAVDIGTGQSFTEADLNNADKLTGNPEFITETLVSLAKSDLPMLVGDKLTKLVTDCLQGFDGVFPDGQGNQGNGDVHIGVEYIERVIMLLDEIKI